MRSSLVFFLVLQCGYGALAGTLAPLTIKDISLMLRSGYSAQAVEREVSVRHFLGTIDAVAEKSLSEAGAAPAFLAGLKTGTYSVPTAEIAAVEAELAAKAKRHTAQAEEGRKLNTLYQSQLAQTRAAAITSGGTSASPIASILKGGLVTSKNGILNTFNDQALDKKKLIGLYFAARWCPSCRKFTPELVEYYNRVAAAHPEFEIVFISSDRSAAAMEAYMRDTQMPWPAVQFDKLQEKDPLQQFAGSGIPCLVVINAEGKVISDSYAGKTYLGPSKVLADLDQIFATGTTGPVALQR